MPASASAMCAVYDSMAGRVAEALAVFACYPCCPNINGGFLNGSSNIIFYYILKEFFFVFYRCSFVNSNNNS
jgi:hypothetical protein